MTEELHLAPRHRKMLAELLRTHVPEAEAWAYGSRVNGRSHDASDLDLVLRAPGHERIPARRLSALMDALSESNIPFLVDVRDWNRLPNSFHREIARAYVVLTRGAETGAEPRE